VPAELAIESSAGIGAAKCEGAAGVIMTRH